MINSVFSESTLYGTTKNTMRAAQPVFLTTGHKEAAGCRFGGLHIANSGLFANQKALEIISKNIANANTVGYSRRQVLHPGGI